MRIARAATIALLWMAGYAAHAVRLRYPVVEVLGLEPRGAGGFKGLAPRPATPKNASAALTGAAFSFRAA